ncbi:hypothetical protein PENSTE_c013G07835 [Penicillium steckii]|uniref:Xylanolytic transcriptional activator regulatory domain-containing protein n=1 Tax=Penicillium steckii TaxID=303698 RepID=A0A1V6T2N3_9EURO|nr:hypothetical protein PENSTE_c013G07835 [Penicillium steckii]
MELTWLPNTPQSRSRTRAPRACPACQRRKKRCRHLGLSLEPSVSGDSTQPPRKSRAIGSAAGNPERRTRARTASADPVLPSLQSTERFVGDLNPEAVIRERLDAPGDSPFRDRVGLWIESSTQNDAKSDKRQLSGTNSQSTLPRGSTIDNERITSLLHQRYLSAMQACHPLPKSTREKLTTIFIAKIHPLIPILDIESLHKDQANSSASTFLDRAICLVAAKDTSVSSDLILQEGGPILSTRQFCTDIYKGLTTAMEAELEPNRLTRIRVLALMSLHCEGHEGAEAASFHLCQSIHQAQTIGLHLDRPGRTSTDPLAKLFWCLWTLDKMHASIGGRPVLLADRDIGVSKPDSRVEGARGAFAVWLAISELLATVISFYRPSTEVTSGWEEGFPAFEDIVEEHTNGDVEFSTLEKISLQWYSAEAMARLGRRALYQIEHGEHQNQQQQQSRQVAEVSLPQTTSTSRVAPELGPFTLPGHTNATTFAPETINLESGIPSAAPGIGEAEADADAQTEAQIPLDESIPIQDFEGSTHGFTDIDMLFGEFLDLSLPTNFWDPVFAEEENT